MYITTIAWHEPAEKLPEKSGRYMVYYGSGIQCMEYSKNHNIFNAHDCETEAEAKEYAINCKYWTEIPGFPDTESEGV